MARKDRIVVTTMMWKRYALFAMWAEALLNVVDSHVEVLVAGSEREVSRELVEGFGFHYVEVENIPIGRKANVRFAACEDLDPDYVVLCGSDDIVSQATWDRYRELAQQGFDEVCMDDLYYYHVHDGQMAYSPGYVDHRAQQPVAPWRMLSRRMCDALEWNGWNEDEKLFLDGHIYDRLEEIPHSLCRLNIRNENLFMCDVKSQVNMTPWIMRPHWDRIDPTLLSKHLRPPVVEALHQLKGRITSSKYLGLGYLRR